MQAREIRSVADLGGEAVGVLTTLVRDMHVGIASRIFGAIGATPRPTQIIHDAAARTIYSGVDHGIRGATRVASALASKAWGRDGDESLESQPEHGLTLTGLHHFDLLNHPTIYTKLRMGNPSPIQSAPTRDQGLGQSS